MLQTRPVLWKRRDFVEKQAHTFVDVRGVGLLARLGALLLLASCGSLLAGFLLLSGGLGGRCLGGGLLLGGGFRRHVDGLELLKRRESRKSVGRRWGVGMWLGVMWCGVDGRWLILGRGN